uniref:MarR family winged helix-turn-helix transcriptional regulator n=1 Tax=Agathobacter sp. TaxID=2021311 RepID=UPI004056FE10
MGCGDFQNDIGHKMRIAHNAIDKYFSSSWKSTGMELTRMQCATLHYLEKHEGEDVFQKDLETVFSITGATATNILKVMEKEGLIVREPMPTDGRLKKLILTEKGILLNKKAHANVVRLEQGMKKDMTPEEIRLLGELLDRVTQNIVDIIEDDAR